MNPPIKKIIQEFRRHLKKQKKQVSTVQSYMNDVTSFFEWLRSSIGEGYTLDDISSSDIKDFRAYLLTRNTTASSINRKISALRQYYEFSIAQKYCLRNPVAEIQALPLSTRLPTILTRKEQFLLLRTVEKSMRPMESAVLLLLLHAGLRSNEICNLTIGDLHLTPRKAKLFIRSDTGRKLRFVFLTSRAQAALYMYCKRKTISILSRTRRDEFLFVLPNGIPITQSYIDSLVKRIGKQAGIAYITPTILRNTYAIQTLLQGEAPEKVERALGISSIKSYQRMVEMIQKNDNA